MLFVKLLCCRCCRNICSGGRKFLHFKVQSEKNFLLKTKIFFKDNVTKCWNSMEKKVHVQYHGNSQLKSISPLRLIITSSQE